MIAATRSWLRQSVVAGLALAGALYGCQPQPVAPAGVVAADASALPPIPEASATQVAEAVWSPEAAAADPARKPKPAAASPARRDEPAPAARPAPSREAAAPAGRPAPGATATGGRPEAAPATGRPAAVPGRPAAAPVPVVAPSAKPAPPAPPPPPPPPTPVTTAAEPSRDELRERLEAAGAKSGDIQISLAWNNKNDLDLHVRPPCGTEIYFSKKKACGGVLDVDRNVFPWGATNKAIENVYFAGGAAAAGSYTVLVKHFNNRGKHEPTRFLVRIKRGGETIWKEGQVMPNKKVSVHSFSWP